ncbi:Sodium-coupled monocarboxylate transporter 2 [Portunus trituberculatus]|uniref:Sodium-coupled monocarboxylate transporter 2 n=1 Tax=Portunus trituberculatus TaxID=210409 RepID=A0A5B7CNC4_PORTR|nr:Sodium-coupled monocarboxylate transporter 2 [Portunus trituberculatus]
MGKCTLAQANFKKPPRGGVKAVVYTDVLQTMLMFVGVLVVVVMCCVDVGVVNIWTTAKEGGRLEVFNRFLQLGYKSFHTSHSPLNNNSRLLRDLEYSGTEPGLLPEARFSQHLAYCPKRHHMTTMLHRNK